MNVQIHYFTGTGNTKFVAGLFAEAFSQKGYGIQEKSMEEGFFSDGVFDYLILGFPKFYGYVPLFYMDFIQEQLKSFQQNQKPKVVLFCTQAATAQTSFQKFVELFEENGYEVVWAETFSLGNNYMIKERSKETSESELAVRIEAAKKRVPIIVEKILSQITYLEGAGPQKALKAIRGSNQIEEIRHQLIKPFRILPKCTNCMDCVRYCPVHALKVQGDRIVFTEDCVMCVRCVSICPVQAFSYDGVLARQYTAMLDQIVRVKET